MEMRTTVNWGLFGFFALIIVGFIVAGFVVSPDAKTDDGYPLNIFFWFMGGMFFLTDAGILLWIYLSNRKREYIENSWFDASAEIIEVGETGTYINDQPRLRFRLLVNSPVHPPCEVFHKQVMPLDALTRFQVGTTIPVKISPDNPRSIMIL